MKLKKLFLLSICWLALGLLQQAQAGEIDVLVQKLVEKGILTPLEAQIVVDETKADVAKQTANHENWALPSWVQSIKMKGDFRLRYQYERREADTEGRERGRIRYRLGFSSNINDQWKVGAGLASGGSGARSTNQTFGDNSSSGGDAFDTPDIRLDYAYAQYAPISGVEMIAGKFTRKKWLWEPTDMLWDGDINPEGYSLHLEKNLGHLINNEMLSHADGFLNSGVWLMDHKDQVDMTDPFLSYLQGGFTWKKERFDLKFASTYYNFNGVQGSTQFDDNSSADTNTYESSLYKYDYDSYHFGTELGVKELLGGLPLNLDERIALFYEYVHNVDPGDQNSGWAAGCKFGHQKVKNKGSWQAKYIYVWLEKDAWLDAFPDSDRYDPGRTDVKSHEIAINYALNKNVILGLDYYNSDRIKSSKNRDQLIQADLVLKF